jgi:hypothetical protein
MQVVSILTMQRTQPLFPAEVVVEREGNSCIKGRMDLPSSKFSWHERSISERLGSCPSSEAMISGGSDPSSPSKNRQ